LRVFVDALNQRIEVQDSINMRVIELFEENNIQIAYPQLDVHVCDIPPLKTKDQQISFEK